MATQEQLRKGFQLGEWRVLPNAGQIEKEGISLHIEPKLVEVLLFLALRPGEVVSREDILDFAWHRQVVCDEALTRTISELRTLLGDSGRDRRFIRTVPKRGYSLITEPVLFDSEPPISPPKTEELQNHNKQAAQASGFSKRLLHYWLYGFGTVSTALLGLLLVVVFVADDVSMQVQDELGREWTSAAVKSSDIQHSFRDILAQRHLQQYQRYAVLPFENLTPDQELKSFTQGLEEDIRTALFSLNGVQVAARTPSNQFSSQVIDQGALPVSEIADALDVDAIVDGTVRLVDGQIRVTVQLLDGKTGFPMWSKRYDQRFDQVLKLQTLLSEDVACELEYRLEEPLLAVQENKQTQKLNRLDPTEGPYGHTRHIEWLAN